MEYVSITAMVITVVILVVLIVGIVIMAVGGKANAKYSNKLMTLRVILQAIVILMLLAGYLLSSQ